MIIKETVERYVLNETMFTVGKRMRAARKAKGWSIRVASPKIGISIPFLCDIENGKANVSANKLHVAAKALGLTMGQLFKGL